MEIAVPPCLLHKSGPFAPIQQHPSVVRASTAPNDDEKGPSESEWFGEGGQGYSTSA